MATIRQACLSRLLGACDDAATPDAKGTAFQRLVAYVFEQIPGVTLWGQNTKDRAGSEEIDLAFRNARASGGLTHLDTILLVECKNWAKRVGAEQVSWFADKLRHKNRTFGVLAAANGITGTPDDRRAAHSQLAKALKENCEIAVITRQDIESLRSGADLVELLAAKRMELVSSGQVYEAPSNPYPSTEGLWATGTASSPGSCGELAQGLLSNGTTFHVTCPITKSSTVRVEMRESDSPTTTGLRPYQRKAELALRRTAEVIGVGGLEMQVYHWSDLDVAKGMGSSTADVVAASRALARCVERELSPQELGEIAAYVESSDGTMYPGIALVDHRTGRALQRYEWWPEYTVVLIVPEDELNTESVRFQGQADLVSSYERIVHELNAAAAAHDARVFAEQATLSAKLNQRFVANWCFELVCERANDYGAIGVNVGHTGTCCGLLFETSERGRRAAAEALVDVRNLLGPSVGVQITSTPPSPRSDSA